LLLVLSEEGELALGQRDIRPVSGVREVKAIDGKTWNHPVPIGNLLRARNGEEMAAFRLSCAGGHIACMAVVISFAGNCRCCDERVMQLLPCG
jgi:hypothetical protein